MSLYLAIVLAVAVALPASAGASCETNRPAKPKRCHRHHNCHHHRHHCHHNRRRCHRHHHKHQQQPKPIAPPATPFGASSIWNQPLSSNAALSPLSDAYVMRLQQSISRDGAWVNTTQYSTPVYTVCAQEPDVHVTLDQPASVHPELRTALSEVPIPRGADPSVDPDGHMVVWQPRTNKMWEFWKARRASDGWHASYGGAMSDMSTDPGYFPRTPGWGASATGLPLLGGLIRIAELHAGNIPHALSIGIPDPRAGVYAWPAQRTDGTSADPLSLPEGTRLRIDPSVDLSNLAMSPFVRMLASAAQRYGIFVTDRSSDVSLYAEDPTPTGSNPYWPSPDGFFGGLYPNQLLQQFPWDHLQVVNAPTSSG
jgi:hypothetical protein